MTSIRQEILRTIDQRGWASANELARSLDRTPADIRHHLRRLMKDRLVESAEARRLGAGRPEQVYCLREEKPLARLVDLLLQAHIQQSPEEEQDQRLRGLAQALADQPVSDESESMQRRLARAVQRLNALGYRARWEAHAAAPRVTLGHCPYASILPAHPELCQVDTILIEQLTRHSTLQTAILAPGKSGIPVCTFVVKANR